MLADLDIGPFHLQRLSINLEVASRHAIRVLGRVEIALELFGCCIEIECIIDQHLLELCLVDSVDGCEETAEGSQAAGLVSLDGHRLG